MAEECKENHAKSEGIVCWPFSRLIVKNVWIMDGYPYFSNIYKALIYGPDGMQLSLRDKWCWFTSVFLHGAYHA